jgi:4'-phosphopantetheinyl transferase
MERNTTRHSIELFGGQIAEFSPSESWDGITEREKEQASKFHHSSDQESYVITRAQLRSVLSSFSGIAPLDIQFSKNSVGKSFFKQYPHVHFSVSHTDHAFIIAVSLDFPLGVDIESLARELNRLKISNVLLTPKERDLLEHVTDEKWIKELLLKTWTQKEALVKCLGRTLEKGMQEFTVLHENSNQVVHSSNECPPHANWFLQTGNWIPSYLISVAMNVPENVKPNIEAHTISPSLFRCA